MKTLNYMSLKQFTGEILYNWPNDLFGTNLVDNHC